MKKAILLAAMAAASCTGFAQDALATHPDAIADKCKENNSVFYQFAKSENYADAYQPWYELYTTCPEYSKNIYKYGASCPEDPYCRDLRGRNEGGYGYHNRPYECHGL